jgi:uncharacterized membrane protein (UPF0127 family)
MKNRFILILYGILIVLWIFSFILLSKKSQNIVNIDGHSFVVEVADTPAKQTQGYSNHQPIKDSEGMLFAFTDHTPKTFWMKNMLFPLDIIWIDGDRIINISPNLPPEGEKPDKKYYSGQPVSFVLEINGGLVDKYGLKIGDKIKIDLIK